jgi:hypothetical protein
MIETRIAITENLLNTQVCSSAKLHTQGVTYVHTWLRNVITSLTVRTEASGEKTRHCKENKFPKIFVKLIRPNKLLSFPGILCVHLSASRSCKYIEF